MPTNYTQYMSVLGTAGEIDTSGPLPSFTIRTRGGDVVKATISETTYFAAMQNLDRLDRDRIPDPAIDPIQKDASPLVEKLRKYVIPGRLIAAEGIYQAHGGREWFDAKAVHVLYSHLDMLMFEHTHWWITQIAAMADKWLNDLFHDKRTYQLDDFAELYQTSLNILGLPGDDNIQEMATLSRLIYGLSSSYLMSGDIRFYLAAKAGVAFQRDAFRSLSADGRFCFWAFGRRRGKYGTKLIIPSENPDDLGSIPLYEQIYALAGLTQFYRISADWEVLFDIRRTVASFNQFYRDPADGSYFSHIDYTTLSPHTPSLGANQSRKNWNSIGDHLPAYLINLVLALDPLPIGREDDLREFRDLCIQMVETTSELIVEKFPDKDANIPYVNERFDTNWKPDHSFGWQQNRAVVGHNLKIAWNLTRVAHFYRSKGKDAQAEKLMTLANRLGTEMGKIGIDQFRSGCFDAVEREPRDGRPVEFAWGNTKDFWQQEQAILAYLILNGYTGNSDYLQHAREMETFWNLFFIDRDRASVFFRVTADGLPIIAGNYADKAGHAVAGYHSFELNYLAHTYNRAFSYRKRLEDNVFCMHFKPHVNSGQTSISVLPDFFGPDDLEVAGVVVNGLRRKNVAPDQYQIKLDPSELGSDVTVELRPTKARNERNRQGSGS
jgi:mannose/cellobiose epimerase-like protein (N-acyl-D-glucosamine 2-epimerase family)